MDQHSRPTKTSWRTSAGIIATFALVGPLLAAFGAAAVFTAMAVAGDLAASGGTNIAGLFGAGLILTPLLGLPVAYGIGIGPALILGVVAAVGQRRTGALSWWPLALWSFVLWFLTALAVGALVETEVGQQTWWIGLLAAYFIGTAGSWLACTLLIGSRA